MGYYMTRLRSYPDPMTCMLLGCVMLHILGQKFAINKEKVTRTAVALFFKYSKMRSKDAYEEIYYNIGRMFHHLGLEHIAQQFYKKVLEYDNSEIVSKYQNLTLKREAAYNLHILYKDSGNFIEARNVLLKYVRI